MLNAHVCVSEKFGRVSTPDDGWKQKIQELLETYASTIRKLSDDVLIAMHREHLRLQADELSETTRAELDRRGLPLD